MVKLTFHLHDQHIWLLTNTLITVFSVRNNASEPNNLKLLQTLAHMNEKLNVLEKAVIKPVAVADDNIGSSDEEDGLSTLPITNLETFEKMETDLQEKLLFNKLVCLLY